MASEIIVQTLKGPSSGANANKVIIPSGQTLDASSGFIPPAGSVVQVKYLDIYGTTAYDDITVSNSTTGFTGVTIFSQLFTTLYDNSDIYMRVSSGQTKKTGYASNANFVPQVDGTTAQNFTFQNHHFYQNTAGTDFRYYTTIDAYYENAGSAGSKTITVLGGTYIETGNGTIIFNFQGGADAGKRRAQVTVMEIKQ